MPFSRSHTYLPEWLRSLRISTFLVLFALCGSLAAQELGNYQKGQSHWPDPFAPYKPRKTQEPSVVNSPRLDQMIKDGKLLLSLDDALALGLENNLDLAIARYNLPIADTDILRTKGGGAFLGVPLGIVAGTQGGQPLEAPGATGSGAGGTSTGAGGAGAGVGGLTASTLGAGPQVEQFDPAITSTFEIEHQVQPQANPLFSGNQSTLNNNVTTGNLGYTQGFSTGTDLSVAFNNSSADVNNPLNTLRPTINSSLRFQARQHLLQGFGIRNQTRFIRIARNNKQASEAAFRAQVIFTVSQIQNIYWNLVAAYEDVKAKQQSVELSQKLASDNRKQVQIGTLAPIEIVRADSQVATANQ